MTVEKNTDLRARAVSDWSCSTDSRYAQSHSRTTASSSFTTTVALVDAGITGAGAGADVEAAVDAEG